MLTSTPAGQLWLWDSTQGGEKSQDSWERKEGALGRAPGNGVASRGGRGEGWRPPALEAQWHLLTPQCFSLQPRPPLLCCGNCHHTQPLSPLSLGGAA